MADYGTLKVSPEQLMASAELAFKNIEACRSALEKISSTIVATGSYWQGNGAERARERYASQASASIDGLNELAAYPQALLQYHGLYSEVIAATQRQVQEISDYTLG